MLKLDNKITEGEPAFRGSMTFTNMVYKYKDRTFISAQGDQVNDLTTDVYINRADGIFSAGDIPALDVGEDDTHHIGAFNQQVDGNLYLVRERGHNTPVNRFSISIDGVASFINATPAGIGGNYFQPFKLAGNDYIGNRVDRNHRLFTFSGGAYVNSTTLTNYTTTNHANYLHVAEDHIDGSIVYWIGNPRLFDALYTTYGPNYHELHVYKTTDCTTWYNVAETSSGTSLITDTLQSSQYLIEDLDYTTGENLEISSSFVDENDDLHLLYFNSYTGKIRLYRTSGTNDTIIDIPDLPAPTQAGFGQTFNGSPLGINDLIKLIYIAPGRYDLMYFSDETDKGQDVRLYSTIDDFQTIAFVRNLNPPRTKVRSFRATDNYTPGDEVIAIMQLEYDDDPNDYSYIFTYRHNPKK